MDITLWTLDFSDKIILPATSQNIGYISMNAKVEFCGSGSCEVVFYSEEVETFVRNHPEGLFIIWGKFQGYITDWQFKQKEKRLFGSHLNSIIHKAVIPKKSITESDGDAQTVANNLITQYIPWLTVAESGGSFNSIAFSKSTYTNADTFIQDYLEKAGAGYKVYIENKALKFSVLAPQSNPLVLSPNNRNVYEVQEDFSNKNTAFGGWYKKTEEDNGTELDTPKWCYITTAEKDGIHVRDTVLSASAPQEAMDELLKCKDTYTVDCKTRNLVYETDYNIGDIVRFQQDKTTIKKQISAVEMWLEGSTYHEEPQLTDYKEV